MPAKLIQTKTGIRVHLPPKKDKPKGYALADGVTQSLLSSWSGCRQAARYYIDFWESARPKDALVFGSLWHWFLETNYEEMRTSGNYFEFKGLADQWVKNEGRRLSNGELMEKVLAMAEALYEPYFEFWVEDFKRDWVSLESKFDLTWEGFRLRGMRDGLFRDRTGHLWLLETKTTARLDEGSMGEALSFDFQNLFYIVASEAELNGERIAGVLYNVIVKPGIKFETKKNPDLPSWFRSAQELVRANPGEYFHRFQISYPQKRVDQFRSELLIKLNEFRRWLEGNSPTYKNEKGCVTRWNCEFLPLCSSNNTAGFTQTRELFSELGGR